MDVRGHLFTPTGNVRWYTGIMENQLQENMENGNRALCYVVLQYWDEIPVY